LIASGKRCKSLIVKDLESSTAAFEPEAREFESLQARQSGQRLGFLAKPDVILPKIAVPRFNVPGSN
jgi:hypothetical protein